MVRIGRLPDRAAGAVVTPAAWGALLGAGAGARRCCWSSARVLALRRPQLGLRVLPYVRDLPQADRPLLVGAAPTGAFRALFGPLLRLGRRRRSSGCSAGNASVRRRLERAGPRR